MRYDVIIVGAGAAGLMCAIEAGKRGRRVLLLDKADAIGEKIRISGGGRCNFTNIYTSPKNYISQNPHFCISALKRYPPQDFIKLVEKHGIAYHEKTLGQLFCDGSAKQIIAMLNEECEAVGVTTALKTSVTSVQNTTGDFTLVTSDNHTFHASSLVIATGGPSIPKMGASGWGYKIAEQFGQRIVTPEPALVPFTLDEPTLEIFRPLAGVAVHVRASCRGYSFEEGLLFTHRGLSGPAILQISSYWQQGDSIHINFSPHQDILNVLKTARDHHPKQDIQTALADILPKRLVQSLCEQGGYHGRLGSYGNAYFQKIADYLHNWSFLPNGTEGFRTAEVTRGGVNVDGLSSTTFETRSIKGLYFIGEVVDVTGHLGGFNFQWAWASGYAAGCYV